MKHRKMLLTTLLSIVLVLTLILPAAAAGTPSTTVPLVDDHSTVDSSSFAIPMALDASYSATSNEHGISGGAGPWDSGTTGDIDTECITLVEGWNLISLPVVLESKDIADVLADISDNVAIVWHYDGSTNTWLWYVPEQPLSTLTTVRDGLGYWVSMKTPGDLFIVGQEVLQQPTEYNVVEGWNLIGFTSTTPMHHSDYLSNLYTEEERDYSIIWGWDASVTKYFSLCPLEDRDGNLEPGHAYWLRATRDGTIVPPGYEIVLYEHTKEVTEEEAENIVELTEDRDRILFGELTDFVAGIQVGDVLVSEHPVPGAEYGFLKRVVGVQALAGTLDEGGFIEIEVEPATLEDVIQQGVISVTQTIPLEDQLNNVMWATGVEVQQVQAGRRFSYAPAEGVKIEGYLRVTADARVDIETHWWHGLQEFEFIFSPGLELEVTLTVEQDVQWDKKYTIATITGAPIPIYGPVTITPRIELIVGTDGTIAAELTAGISYDRVYDVGLRYLRNEGWSTISNMHGEGFTLDGPHFTGSAEARVFAGAVLSGTVGVSYIAQATLRTELLGNIRATGSIETSPWHWQYDLELYLSAQAFADLELCRIAGIGWESDIWEYPDPPYNLAYGASGRVTTDGGDGLEGAQINFTGDHSSTTTNEDGYWTKHLLSGEVTVTPEKAGYVFDPLNRVVIGSARALDFQASERQEPIVTIFSPTDYSHFIEGETISFAGGATDRFGAPITGDGLVWGSQIDGMIGTGNSFVLQAEQLSEGSHIITLEATDQHGTAGRASVSILVGERQTLDIGDENVVSLGSDGRLYLISKGRFHVLSTHGQLKWSFDVGRPITAPLAIGLDGTVHVGGLRYNEYYSGFPEVLEGGKVYAVVPDGEIKWSFPPGNPPGAGIIAFPAVAADGTVYVGVSKPWWNGEIYALSPNGEPKWHFDLEYFVDCPPTVGPDGTVYIGSRTILYALSPDGELKWSFQAAGKTIGPPPLIAPDGTVYLGTYHPTFGYSSGIYALSPDGHLKWASVNADYDVRSAPALGADGTVYYAVTRAYQNDTIYARSPEGDLKWSFVAGYRVRASPVIAPDGTIYVGSHGRWGGNGELFALCPDGRSKWSSEFDGGVFSLAMLPDERGYKVCVGTDDGRIHFLTISPQEPAM